MTKGYIRAGFESGLDLASLDSATTITTSSTFYASFRLHRRMCFCRVPSISSGR